MWLCQEFRMTSGFCCWIRVRMLTSLHWIATRSLANVLIELHYIARWGSHYSPRLICNERLSSANRPQMDSNIDFTLNKKKILLSEDETPITRTSNIAHTLLLIMHFRKINYWSAISVFVFAWTWTAASLCFGKPAVLLLALVWGQISQQWWRSINPDRSIVPPPFTDSDQLLALRYRFQLERYSWRWSKMTTEKINISFSSLAGINTFFWLGLLL